MRIEAAQLGCPECDLLMDVPELIPGKRAVCPRCRCVLSVCFSDPFVRAFSYALTALILLTISFGFPFMSLERAGVENTMTLLQTVTYLLSYGADVIALLVFVFVILIPALMMLATGLLAFFLHSGYFARWMVPVARWVFHLNAWAMVEVFSIGVIVSLVKIAAMANVELGGSFWAYMGFSVMFLLAFSSLDRITVWTTIERLRAAS